MTKEKYREYLMEQIKNIAAIAELNEELPNTTGYAAAIECIKIQNTLMAELYRLDSDKI